MQLTRPIFVLGFLGLIALGGSVACGDIGLSAGPTGTDGSTTAGSTTAGTTTAGSTTSGTTTSGTTTTGSTTSGTTTTGSTTSGTTTMSASTCTTTTETYANFGMAFIQTNCISCHGATGDLPHLDTLANIQSARADALSQITSGAMPMGSTLSATDKTNSEAWLNCTTLP